ncbi:hypothetical protein TRIUR3_15860 [Triticum urartu]|uniref:Uncharacterized protein n=1 Tax=Triticum urartu TaxID=4572 RepID=M7ZQP2_TRIUA|nr:hypothetical protein TRIUR3_15860 [Triticum urartu]
MATFVTSSPVVMGSARPGRATGARRCMVARASVTMAAPAVMATGRTHCEVLGLGAGASRGEIKSAYRRLAREVHPDAVGGLDAGAAGRGRAGVPAEDVGDRPVLNTPMDLLTLRVGLIILNHPQTCPLFFL